MRNIKYKYHLFNRNSQKTEMLSYCETTPFFYLHQFITAIYIFYVKY